MDQIVCPNCGEPLDRAERLKEVVESCGQFLGQCTCGQKYHLTLSTGDSMLLSYPDRKAEIVC
ncbi:MAG: hypothetical protein NWF14_06365 [Candidatus Bathyarchaeota archaeon]|nr:hypothetical protein [Candidatus Bathyarchaeota archaeon]